MSNDDENRKQSKPREGALHSLPKGMSLVTYILQCKSTFNVAVSKTDEIKGASAVQCKTRNAAARPHSQHQPGAERRDRRRWRHQKRPSMRGGGVNAVGGVHEQQWQRRSLSPAETPQPVFPTHSQLASQPSLHEYDPQSVARRDRESCQLGRVKHG